MHVMITPGGDQHDQHKLVWDMIHVLNISDILFHIDSKSRVLSTCIW